MPVTTILLLTLACACLSGFVAGWLMRGWIFRNQQKEDAMPPNSAHLHRHLTFIH